MNADDSKFIASDLIKLFNNCFADSENTRLTGGASEPLYLPANQACDYHQILFTRDYFASALHEVSHWCIAGQQRRLQVDYGYWYQPDGRDTQQQDQFEKVEAKPQALEWIFATCCGASFRVSADNLQGSEADLTHFKKHISEAAIGWIKGGLPSRASQFCHTLQRYYQQPTPLAHHFTAKTLR